MSDEAPRVFDRGSRARLTLRTRERFTGTSLFDAIARTVCEAECLPRKELFEAWEIARFVRRHFRGGRVVDLAAGHGLLAWILLVLDDTSPQALCVDPQAPPSAARLAEVLLAQWPRLRDRCSYLTASLDDVPLGASDLVVSSHPCGELTDRVIARAIEARARVAVLPCCHDLAHGDTGALDSWMPGPLAMDTVRAHTLRSARYRVRTHVIPADITPMNRLLLGEPLR